MNLKLCPRCRRPFMASHEFCPKCPRPEYNQESWANLGCLLMMIAPLILMTLFWIFLFSVFLFR